MSEAVKQRFFLEDDPQINSEKSTVVSFMLPNMVLTTREHYFLYLFMKFLKESDNTDWKNWLGNDLVNHYDTFVKDHYDHLEKQFKEYQPFNTDTIGIKFSGNYPDEKESEERCEQLEKYNNKITNLTADVGRPLLVTMDLAYMDLINKKHYGNKRLNEVMSGQTMNTQNLEEHMEQEKQEKRRQAREERRRIETLKSKEKSVSMANETELTTTIRANQQFMNSIDPWMQRKEEQKIEEIKQEALEVNNTESESKSKSKDSV